MKANTNPSAKKKLLPAAGMLMISAAMLATSTFAWFTMNKEVSVTGMQMKAQAEKGLLINEVAAVNSTTWDEEAVAGDSDYVALRPASTSDLSNWWHANSKNSSNEAGASGTSVDTVNTVAINGNYYTQIGGSGSSISSHTLASGSGGTSAEKIVYYKDLGYSGSGTNYTSGSYQDGEGYYVMYKYYIKASSDTAVDVTKDHFQIKVTAEKQNSENSGSGTLTDLDKALRVGVKIDDTIMIFAPNYTDNDQSYNVAASATTINATAVTAHKGGTAANFNTSGALTLPNATSEGKEVDVYVWFEGEDPNCKSDNLTATLDQFKVNITFTNADFG